MSIKLSTFSYCFFLGSRIVLKVISQATTTYFYHISLIFNLTLSNFSINILIHTKLLIFDSLNTFFQAWCEIRREKCFAYHDEVSAPVPADPEPLPRHVQGRPARTCQDQGGRGWTDSASS